ncbi:MAG: hypothetical protein QXI97_09035 [Nitrososphaerota archaeon]
MTEEPEEEFRDIACEIIRPELTAEELDEIAFRWALNRLKILKKYGVELRPDFEKLKREMYVKAAQFRERLGLPTTSSRLD